MLTRTTRSWRQRLTLTDLLLKGAQWFQVCHTFALSNYSTPAFVNMLCNQDHIYVFNKNNFFSQMWCETCQLYDFGQCWGCHRGWNQSLSGTPLIQVNSSYSMNLDNIRLYLSKSTKHKMVTSLHFALNNIKFYLCEHRINVITWNIPGMGLRTRQWRSGWFCQLKPFWRI